jgi:hypothetical protein
MTVIKRISRLEAVAATKKKYFAVCGSVIFPERNNGPFRVQPWGNNQEPDFFLPDRAALEEFSQRPDVSLTILQIAGDTRKVGEDGD